VALLGGASDMSGAEIAEQIREGLLVGSRVRLETTAGFERAAFSAHQAQSLLLGLAVGVEALPRGGTLRLAETDGGYALLPEGTNAAWPAALVGALRGEPAPGPRALLSAYFAVVLTAAGWEASFGLAAPGAPLALLIAPAR
jgi:histidine phosphotransferase ChpT